MKFDRLDAALLRIARLRAIAAGAASTCRPTAGLHIWQNDYGEDWTPNTGDPCDCGARRWHVQDDPPEPDPIVADTRGREYVADKHGTVRRLVPKGTK